MREADKVVITCCSVMFSYSFYIFKKLERLVSFLPYSVQTTISGQSCHTKHAGAVFTVHLGMKKSIDYFFIV